MIEQRYRWKNKQIREQLSVLSQEVTPTLVLKDATYLHSKLRRFLTQNIWIHEDRIVYCGPELPSKINESNIISLEGKVVVPGYIEPHVHPFQLYNPQSFALYASKFGTTTLIQDNLMLALLLEKKKAFTLLRKFRQLPVSLYWWSRFDSQTVLGMEDDPFTHANVKSWLEHDAVLQGGELTAWPQLLAGDDMLLHWVQEAKRMRKRVEGHLPGASPLTLTKMALAGVDSDHESISGEDVYQRLLAGLTVSLRHSSIRPDIPKILEELKKYDLTNYDDFMMTTDGSSPSFYKEGVSNILVKLAIDNGVPVVDAYQMVTANVAKYYRIDHLHGEIAPGQVANVNILDHMLEPKPSAVLSKGVWIVDMEGNQYEPEEVNWKEYDLAPLSLDWSLQSDDLQFSMPFGLEMVDAVITKPYSIGIDPYTDALLEQGDECFLMLVDREGRWRINTLLKGFAKSIGGLCSSFSSSGDLLLIGKSKEDMLEAFEEMKRMKGGIVLVQKGEVEARVSLSIAGTMSDKPLEELMIEESKFSAKMKEHGYSFQDPIYSLLFFCSTHLPYIRLTSQGIYDVMKKTILFPTIMR
ncbi:adenine deaminase C-terminal domain-containing protein [Mangrovibacillus cuniculi]|uniref:adenine deaminase n=1 Tax=Mangrovibacillus cuniculi TaxID=2593652 RepID=A0A7S8C8R5_9BACI|nr:adenine deaminase C-terminal domain-containing protein [Mangrovibacillus cuniculi]QPC45495.1 adenine deaminase [Mangrovibacillus cuniculi]